MKSSSLRTILAFACAAAFAVATQSAFAQTPDASTDKPRHEGHKGEHGGRGPGDPAKHLEKLTQELSLTADQQAKIKPILEGADAQRKQIWENTALSKEDKRAQMKQAHEGVQSQLKGILTAEQQQKLDQLKEKHGRHGHDGDDQPAK